jgi:hypothetical protein
MAAAGGADVHVPSITAFLHGDDDKSKQSAAAPRKSGV